MKNIDWTWLLVGIAVGMFVIPNLRPMLNRATVPTRK